MGRLSSSPHHCRRCPRTLPTDRLKPSRTLTLTAQAFGCGAFCNPAHRVAQAYKQALSAYAADFDVIAFGIFHAGTFMMHI